MKQIEDWLREKMGFQGFFLYLADPLSKVMTPDKLDAFGEALLKSDKFIPEISARGLMSLGSYLSQLGATGYDMLREESLAIAKAL